MKRMWQAKGIYSLKNLKFYYFMADPSDISGWCCRIKINGTVSVLTIKRSVPTCLHIFTPLPCIPKPPFNSLNSHSAGSTAGNCGVRGCQSCGFPKKYGSWGGKQKRNFQWAHWSCCRSTAGLPKRPLSQDPVSMQETAKSMLCKWPQNPCDLALLYIFLLLSIKAAF